jgi:hypothetical protein
VIRRAASLRASSANDGWILPQLAGLLLDGRDQLRVMMADVDADQLTGEV